MIEPNTTAPPPIRKLLGWRRLLALAPFVVTLAIGEIAMRWRHASKGYPALPGVSFRDHRIDLIRRAFPAQYDPLLGYVPSAGYSGSDNVWGTRVSIRADGLRSNGAATPVSGPALLAVGDSFVFGDQVHDEESWPAGLERRLERPVHNGGVFGYGFDQTVLRAEQLLEQLDVHVLVCSLIADDLSRCELSRRYTHKPWFELVDEGLELRGVPVPDASGVHARENQWMRDLLGQSALCDVVCWNVAPNWWAGQPRFVRVHPAGTGLEIGKRLLARLEKACAQRKVKLLLVLQAQGSELGPAAAVGANKLLEHAARAGLDTLDLDLRLRELSERDPSLGKMFFAGHMTAAGNQWVAEQISEHLRGR